MKHVRRQPSTSHKMIRVSAIAVIVGAAVGVAINLIAGAVG